MPGVPDRREFGARGESRRGALVSVGPERSEHLVATTAASVAVMGGHPRAGWLRLAPGDLKTTRQLTKWFDLGVGVAGSLPAKG